AVPGLPPRQGRHPVDDLGAPLRRARREHVQRGGRLHPLPAQQDRQGVRPAADPDTLGRRLPAAGRGLMRSIRLSLIVSFLLLLGGALGAVSWLTYRTSVQALQSKEVSTRALLSTQFKDRCQEIRDLLDKRLLARARALVSRARVEPKIDSRYEALNALGVLGTAVAPYGHLTGPLWLAEAAPFRTREWIHYRL